MGGHEISFIEATKESPKAVQCWQPSNNARYRIKFLDLLSWLNEGGIGFCLLTM